MLRTYAANVFEAQGLSVLKALECFLKYAKLLVRERETFGGDSNPKCRFAEKFRTTDGSDVTQRPPLVVIRVRHE